MNVFWLKALNFTGVKMAFSLDLGYIFLELWANCMYAKEINVGNHMVMWQQNKCILEMHVFKNPFSFLLLCFIFLFVKC